MTLEIRLLSLLRPSAGGIQTDMSKLRVILVQVEQEHRLPLTPHCIFSTTVEPVGSPLISSGAALLQSLMTLLPFHACFNLVSSSFIKPTSSDVLLIVGISIRELSVVAKTESVKWLNSAVRQMSLVLLFLVVIFKICEIPAREREKDCDLISVKLRGEKA